PPTTIYPLSLHDALPIFLKSLEPHKKYVTSFGNLQNEAMVGGVHSLAPATWLSGKKPVKGSASANMSITLDQLVAKNIGQNTTLDRKSTRLNSSHLGISY